MYLPSLKCTLTVVKMVNLIYIKKKSPVQYILSTQSKHHVL